MSLVLTYLASLLAFLAIDAVWLKNVMRPLFEQYVGGLLRDDILLAPAAGFYMVYVAGILYFCTQPAWAAADPWSALFRGAALGFLAFGTYEATNMTTLKGWAWPMVWTDVAWGMAITAFTAWVGYRVGAWMGLVQAG